MKTWKFAALVLSLACLSFFTGCKGSSADAPGVQTAQVVTDTLTIDDVLAQADSLVGKEVVFEGVCTHICAHGASKIFLMGSDDSKMLRVEASKELGSFKKEAVNSLVTVRGTIVEDRIDEAYLLKWEEQVKAAEKKSHDEEAAGCSVEQKARGESATASAQARIADYRRKIADRKEKEGKEYLSFYHAETSDYQIK